MSVDHDRLLALIDAPPADPEPAHDPAFTAAVLAALPDPAPSADLAGGWGWAPLLAAAVAVAAAIPFGPDLPAVDTTGLDGSLLGWEMLAAAAIAVIGVWAARRTESV